MAACAAARRSAALYGQVGARQLEAAVAALEADHVLLEALGPLLAKAYIAVKRLESSYFAEESAEEETRAHFYKY